MDSEVKLQILFTRDEIAAALRRLASEIKRDYHGKCPLLIGILKGSFMFLADLIRLLDFPLEVDFIGLSSYGTGRQTSGRVRVVQGLTCPVNGRHVLIIEDIVDAGLTISFLIEYLLKKKPASLQLCALMDKPARRQAQVPIDYLGFTVPDKFVVGYGLDYAGKYRNLPDICVLEGDE